MAAGKQARNDREAFKLVLGFKQLVVGGLVLTVSLVWIFVLGVLVGKGEVTRLLSKWGVMTETAAKEGIVPGTATAPTPVQQASPTQTPAPEGKTAAPKTDTPPAPVVSAMTPALTAENAANKPAPVSKQAARKPSKPAKPPEKTKAVVKEKPEKESVAARLKFQNSLGSPPKPAKPKAKGAAAVQTASMTGAPGTESQPQPAVKVAAKSYRLKIGTYRNTQEAQRAMAELKQKGLAASLSTGKDKNGAVYVVRSDKVKSRAEAEKLTQKLKGSRYQGAAVEEAP